MLYRYGVDPITGKKKKTAIIYTRDEHKIDNNRVTREVFKVIRKLKERGYEAYIVGGAVRDLMQGRKPKDFDIATNAQPQQIRRIFSNSRVIGKRFKLCHVYFGSTILEVCTFRSKESDNFVNSYGDIDEDARRRDFSINALYYCPLREWLFDYVDGFKDIKKGRVRSLIDLNETFHQDPVRMIRAIKYSVLTGFNLTTDLKKSIKHDSLLLENTPVSRLVEELFKILQSSKATEIFVQMVKYNLFQSLLPEINNNISNSRKTQNIFYKSIKELDIKMKKSPSTQRSVQIYFLVRCFFSDELKNYTKDEVFHSCYKLIKKSLKPLTPANVEVEKSVKLILKDYGIVAYKKRDYYRRRKPTKKDNKI